MRSRNSAAMGFVIPFLGAVFLSAMVFVLPETANAQLDPNYIKCLQGNECQQCEKNPGHTNPWGYTGFYQFGAELAASVLCSNYAAVKAKGVTDNGHQLWDKMDTGSPKCDYNTPLARQYGITSYNDWAQGGGNKEHARTIQTAMMAAANENEWATIKANGLDKYIGQTINGVVITKETMLAMAWLKGYGGMRDTIVNGSTNVKDRNGTSTLAYASCLQGCLDNGGKKGQCTFVVEDICSAKKK